MKFICIAIFSFAALHSASQEQSGKKIKYYCAPCGCVNDGKIFDTAGNCAACRMRLLEVGTYNYSTVSTSKKGLIVFVSNRLDNKNQVFMKNMHAAGPAKPVAEGGMPKISPDGKKIVFEKGENNITIYDIASGTFRDVSSKINLPGLQSPSWNTGNDAIFFAAGTFPNLGIYKFNVGNNTTDTIVAGEALRYACVQSPDGKKLAYRFAKGTSAQNMRRGLAILDLATKEEKLITSIGEYCSWSPDGRKLAFHWPDSSTFAIFVVNLDGTELKKLTTVGEGSCELPSWSADGKLIYFQTNRRKGNWEIWSMNTDGTGQQPLVY